MFTSDFAGPALLRLFRTGSMLYRPEPLKLMLPPGPGVMPVPILVFIMREPTAAAACRPTMEQMKSCGTTWEPIMRLQLRPSGIQEILFWKQILSLIHSITGVPPVTCMTCKVWLFTSSDIVWALVTQITTAPSCIFITGEANIIFIRSILPGSRRYMDQAARRRSMTTFPPGLPWAVI